MDGGFELIYENAYSSVVVNKRLLGHSKKSQQVSPQISRLNRVLMNLNERGEGIFEVFGVFWSFLECPSNLLLTTTTLKSAQK